MRGRGIAAPPFFMKKALVVFLLSACIVPARAAKLEVVSTIFPVYEFAREVGGSKTDVKMLIIPGCEPHSFDPKPKDMVALSKAAVFVYVGDAMEPWAADLARGSGNKKLRVVNAGTGARFFDSAGHEDHDADEHGHNHGTKDPHIWLDFDNARIMVDNITAAFSSADASNAKYYAANAATFKKQLTKLDADFKKRLASCKTRTMLNLGHFSFGYMARRYNFEYLSAQGIRPDSEPSPKKVAELVTDVRSKKLKFVFTEELLNPRFADVVAGETGAKVLKLNPLGGITKKDFTGGAGFIALMRRNLDIMAKGLQCGK